MTRAIPTRRRPLTGSAGRMAAWAAARPVPRTVQMVAPEQLRSISKVPMLFMLYPADMAALVAALTEPAMAALAARQRRAQSARPPHSERIVWTAGRIHRAEMAEPITAMAMAAPVVRPPQRAVMPMRLGLLAGEPMAMHVQPAEPAAAERDPVITAGPAARYQAQVLPRLVTRQEPSSSKRAAMAVMVRVTPMAAPAPAAR